MSEILSHVILCNGRKWQVPGDKARELLFDDLIFQCEGHSYHYGMTEDPTMFIYHIECLEDFNKVEERLGEGVKYR